MKDNLLDRNVIFWLQNTEDSLGYTVEKEHITGRFLLVNNSNQHDLKCRCPNTYANKVHEKGMIGCVAKIPCVWQKMSAVCGKNPLILIS